MAVSLLPGVRRWKGTRDNRGHREYKVTFRVIADTALDGPAGAQQCPGLPNPGDVWVIGNDVDLWAWFRWGPTEIALVDEQDIAGCLPWDLEYTASTAPDEDFCR